jgi:hypothetical protein
MSVDVFLAALAFKVAAPGARARTGAHRKWRLGAFACGDRPRGSVPPTSPWQWNLPYRCHSTASGGTELKLFFRVGRTTSRAAPLRLDR